MQHSQAVVGQLIGQDALLQCIVTANPELSLAWLKDGEPLALSSKHMINNNTWHFNLYTKTYVLLITDVTEQDFGIYTCSASNAIGQSEQSIKLVGKLSKFFSCLFNVQANMCVYVSYTGLY